MSAAATSLHTALGLGCAAFAVCASAQLRPPRDPAAPEARVGVENCIGSDRLAMHFGEDAAVLDAEDHAGMRGLIASRYSALGAGGFEPLQLVLWRRPGGDWVYVAIVANGQKPGGVCFSATIAAQPFPESNALRRKYKLGGTRT